MSNDLLQPLLTRVGDWWRGWTLDMTAAGPSSPWQYLQRMGDGERWALLGVVFLLFLMVLNRLERRARNHVIHRDAVSGDVTLVYAPARRTLARVNLGLGFALLATGLLLGGMPAGGMEWAGLLVAMVLLVDLPVYLILEVDRRRVVLSAREVTVYGVLGRARTLSWEQVTGMTWSKLRRSFTLHGQGGDRLIIPDGLAGLEHLERRCHARLTADRYAKAKPGFR